jgi:hypothetical protein
LEVILVEELDHFWVVLVEAWIEVAVPFLEVEVDRFLGVNLGDKPDW